MERTLLYKSEPYIVYKQLKLHHMQMKESTYLINILFSFREIYDCTKYDADLEILMQYIAAIYESQYDNTLMKLSFIKIITPTCIKSQNVWYRR